MYIDNGAFIEILLSFTAINLEQEQKYNQLSYNQCNK